MFILITTRLLVIVNINLYICYNFCNYYTELDGLILKSLHNRNDESYRFYYGRHNGEITELAVYHISKSGIKENKQLYHIKISIFHIVTTMTDERSLTVYEKGQYKPNPP